ncbi:hypothetical protein [Streptomyces sp. NRRL B-24720]|uniref:hypothetical protein n=1 Tax=Streptomyces sp. NRRL B-24720 TaxID=1476876 RepID=UPI000691153C|nr:hypothetical protein [Streptomyces sp. NRRL B-24720]
MTGIQAHATGLTSQYIAQVTGDLERNVKEQERISADSAKAPKTDTKPTLVNLIRSHLEQQSEPRSATEISAALTQDHPDRGVKTTVVRTTLKAGTGALVVTVHGPRVLSARAVADTVHARDSKPAGAVCGQEERGSGHDVASAPSS